MKKTTIVGTNSLLSVSMALNMAAPLLAVEPQTAGTLATNVVFANNDKEAEIKARNIQFSLIKVVGTSETTLGTISLQTEGDNIHGCPISIRQSGQTYQINVENLPLGDYKIRLTGDKHATYTSDIITIKESSKQLDILTNSKSFTYGDLNEDDQVDQKDFAILEGEILNDTHNHDLTGDGKVDLEDLALLKLNMSSTDYAVLYNTSFISIVDLVDTDEMEGALQYAEVTISGEGSLADLFDSSSEKLVQFAFSDENATICDDNPLTIPIILADPVEMAEIQLTSPETDGAPQRGSVIVEYLDENGKDATMELTFDERNSQETQTLGAVMPELPGAEPIFVETASTTTDAGTNVLVISLGARVVVKSITVSVTAVQDSSGNTNYVALQEVNFIQDIVPEDPQASNGLVENLVAVGGNESVSLSWDKTPNISGYRLSYGTSSGKYTATLNTENTNMTVTGLENNTTYYFALQSTYGNWVSSYSDQVSAMPAPTSPPTATTLLQASPLDQGAELKWNSSKNASSYTVWMKKTDSAEPYVAKTTTSSTSIMVGDMENDVEYSVYVTCTNSIGTSAPSNILTVTPEKENIDGPTLPVTGRIDPSAVTNIIMENPANVKNELYPNGWKLSSIYDQDYATDWVANLWYQSSAFTFEFDQPYDMSYFVYVAKVDGLYHASLDRIAVTLWDEEGNQSSYTVDYSIKYTDDDGKNYCVVDFPRTNVSKIKFAAAQWDGSYTNVSISEVVFYEHNGIDDEIAALFGDDAFTTLKSSVTQGDIEALRARVAETGDYVYSTAILNRELDMAETLLLGEELTGYLKTNLTSINSTNDDPGLSNISPLGLIAYANSDLVVYADIPVGETVTLIPSQYYAEAFEHLGSGIVLESGRNIITVEQLTKYNDVSKGGVLYYRYSGNQGDNISLHLDSWYKSGVRQENWTVPVLDLYDIYELSETEIKERIALYVAEMDELATVSLNNAAYNPMNSTEISLRNVLLSVPATEFYAGFSGYGTQEAKIEAVYHTVLAWEELLMVCNVAYGLDNYENPRGGRQNIRYMRMTDAFMYAGGNHIGIQYGSVKALAQGKPTSVTGEGDSNALFGWGIAHEIGHNLDRMGRVEITNNIYSLLAQTWDGGTGYGDSRVSYGDIYTKVTSGNTGISNNVFTQLGMYWQLQQAYCDSDPLEFYNKVNKEYKANAYSAYSNEERFALIVSSLVEKNLTDFFTAWGVVFSDSALAELSKYETETRLIQYMNNHSRQYRLESGTGISSGTASLTAKSQEGNAKKILLTIDHSFGEEDLLGFEIYRNGGLIGFTTGTSYSDTIGGINNTALEYSIKPVDQLGDYYGSTVKADEFRIEYDDVIDKSAYTVSEVDNGILLTFSSATAVSGILIDGENIPTEGEFTVKIATEVEEEAVSVQAEESRSQKISLLLEECETDCDLSHVHGQQEAVTVSLSGVMPSSLDSRENGYTTALTGDFGENDVISSTKFINYFNKPGVDSTDTRIGVYDAVEILIEGAQIQDIQDNISILGYIGDNVSFMDTFVGELAEAFDTGAEILPAGTVIVLGEYLGDPYFNEITMMGRFVDSHGVDGSDVSYIERSFAGTTYMFGYTTETVSTISDGLFIFVPDIQNEAELQGEEHSCATVSLFPYQMKASMQRNTQSSGSYQTSDTTWLEVPSLDTMPLVYFTSGEE